MTYICWKVATEGIERWRWWTHVNLPSSPASGDTNSRLSSVCYSACVYLFSL